MKNFIFLSITVILLTACNSKSNNTESNVKTENPTTEQTKAVDSSAVNKKREQLYSCPMHPEVKGAKGSECPKCGMALTEPVK